MAAQANQGTGRAKAAEFVVERLKESRGRVEQLERRRSIAGFGHIVSVSTHEYMVDGAARVFEAVVESEGSVIARGRALLPDLEPIRLALDTLERLVESPIWRRYPQVEISVDLADQPRVAAAPGLRLQPAE